MITKTKIQSGKAFSQALKNIAINKDMFQVHTEIFYTDPAEINIIDKITIPAADRPKNFPVPFLFYHDFPAYYVMSQIIPEYNKKILAFPSLSLKWYNIGSFIRGENDSDCPLIIKELVNEGGLILKWYYDGAIQHKAFIVIHSPDRSYVSIIKSTLYSQSQIEKVIYINSNIYNYMQPFYFAWMVSPAGRHKSDMIMPLANKGIDTVLQDFIIIPFKFQKMSPANGFGTYFDFNSTKLIFEFNLKF